MVAAVIVSEDTILPVAVILPCAVMLALALIVPVTDRALLYWVTVPPPILTVAEFTSIIAVSLVPPVSFKIVAEVQVLSVLTHSPDLLVPVPRFSIIET